VKNYPWDLQPTLTLQIQLCREKEAHDSLRRLISVVWRDRRKALDYRKLRCAGTVGPMMRAAYYGAAPSEVILREHCEFMDRLTRVRTSQRLRAEMHGYLDSLLVHVRPFHRTTMEALIARLREDMRSSVARQYSLSQYAETAGISPRHLSRCFRAIAGRSFREEILHLRIELARMLLSQSSLKIAEISHRVGLRDPSQFVAQFRKLTGITPGAYRRHAQARIPPPVVANLSESDSLLR
jgi:AraC-like DNA-binding protein